MPSNHGPVATPNPLRTLRERAVFGHRGNRAHAPENTLFALREAVDLGVDGLEFDVRLTSDGEVVVMHDATLDRTTNGTGLLAARTWDDVRRLDAGARFSPDGGATFPFRGLGITVPRLADVLDALPSTSMIIEIKEPAASAAVRRVLLECRATERCTVGAFRHETLAPFDGSGIARTASTREVVRMYAPAVAGRVYTSLPFQSMSLPPRHKGIPVPLGALARSVAPAGVPIIAWTINDPAQAERWWRKGVRGVISDDPGVLLSSRGDRVGS